MEDAVNFALKNKGGYAEDWGPYFIPHTIHCISLTMRVGVPKYKT